MKNRSHNVPQKMPAVDRGLCTPRCWTGAQWARVPAAALWKPFSEVMMPSLPIFSAKTLYVC